MSRDVNGRLISHDHLRYFEKGFPNLVYFEGVFHSSLGEIYKRRFQHHVDGISFRALILGDNDERIKSNEDIYGEGYHTYLRLEDVLQEDRLYPSPKISSFDIYGEGYHTYLKLEDVLQEDCLYHTTNSLRHDWENGTLREDVTSNPDRPYAVHHRPHVTGVFYEPPVRLGAGGIYVLHCGSTSSFNHNTTADPNFILKVGHSKDILNRLHQHQQISSNLRIHGEVEFLFGVEIDKCDRVPAESLLKVMLTEFGFSRVTFYNNGGRSTETFSFNEKTLPLIHDVVCGIRYVYDPPIDRIVPDHENSVENPLYEQGLPRQLRTPVQPHPQKLMEFLSEVPSWNTSLEWRGALGKE